MIKFNKMGTKHATYLERFEKKYVGNSEIYIDVIDQNKVHILGNDKNKIDEFTSKTTCDQFLTVLESLGYIIPRASTYKIVSDSYDFKNVTTAIFSKSENKKVQMYRESRKIAFLYLMNIVDDEFIKKNHITKTKGDLVLQDIKTECSKWEIDAKKDYEKIINILERIKHEYKI